MVFVVHKEVCCFFDLGIQRVIRALLDLAARAEKGHRETMTEAKIERASEINRL